jgi:hypothetical protein
LSRVFLERNDPPDPKGVFWFDFSPNLDLKEVIAGAQCSPETLKALAEILKAYDGAVECSWAYMRKDAFLLVRHDFSPPWFTPST